MSERQNALNKSKTYTKRNIIEESYSTQPPHLPRVIENILLEDIFLSVSPLSVSDSFPYEWQEGSYWTLSSVHTSEFLSEISSLGFMYSQEEAVTWTYQLSPIHPEFGELKFYYWQPNNCCNRQ